VGGVKGAVWLLTIFVVPWLLTGLAAYGLWHLFT
jgi:hypothetical protein